MNRVTLKFTQALLESGQNAPSGSINIAQRAKANYDQVALEVFAIAASSPLATLPNLGQMTCKHGELCEGERRS